MKLRSLALAALGALMLGGVASAATGYDVAANCTVAPLKFVFDGESVAPQVANGNPAGFICSGTSYVPLRFVASALGKRVAWDGSTDTVTITTPATSSASGATPATPTPAGYDVAANCTVAPLQFVFDGQPEAPQVANGNPAGFICNGTSYVPVRIVASALGKSVAWNGGTDTVTVSTPSTGSSATVQAASNATLGRILVDSAGMTLYRLTQDSPTFSACRGSCAALWPPLTVTGTPSLAAGLSGTLSTLTRSDGTLQVEYDGIPLYLFAGDSKPGDVNGQGADGVWFAVKVGDTASSASGSGG